MCFQLFQVGGQPNSLISFGEIWTAQYCLWAIIFDLSTTSSRKLIQKYQRSYSSFDYQQNIYHFTCLIFVIDGEMKCKKTKETQPHQTVVLTKAQQLWSGKRRRNKSVIIGAYHDGFSSEFHQLDVGRLLEGLL